MARFEFRLPDIGEGVTEGEIVNWLVGVGDAVTENQDVVEVMTDKATVTIGAPKDGRVTKLGAEAGEVVRVGSVLVVFDVAEAAGLGRMSSPPFCRSPVILSREPAVPLVSPWLRVCRSSTKCVRTTSSDTTIREADSGK